MTCSFWASVIHRTERRQAVKGDEGTKLFLWEFISIDVLQSNKTQVQQSTLWLCPFRLSLKLRHYLWEILCDDFASPRISEDIKTSACCLGRGKAFFFLLFPRESSSPLSRDKCWTEMEREKPRGLWLSRRLRRRLDFLQSETEWQSWMCARLRVGCLLWDLGPQCSHL